MADAAPPRAAPPAANLEDPPAENAVVRNATASARAIGCPYLIAESGAWRLGVPAREHRCAAVTPPAPLAPEKQARLCLTSGHASCATYVAAAHAREARLGSPPPAEVTRWGYVRTTSVIEDAGGVRARAATFLLDRRRWPAIPAVLLVTTLLVLALSGLRGGSSAAVPSASPTRSPAAVTARPPVTPRPTAGPSEPDSSGPTSTAAASAASQLPAPQPSASFRTYVVRSGDTMGGIANRFDTTVTALTSLNGITDPARLRIGQVLTIPN